LGGRTVGRARRNGADRLAKTAEHGSWMYIEFVLSHIECACSEFAHAEVNQVSTDICVGLNPKLSTLNP
jgi:hypothetical protein